jgi:hypothetical protein
MQPETNVVMTYEAFLQEWIKKNKSVQVYQEHVSPLEVMERYWESKAYGDLSIFQASSFNKVSNLTDFFSLVLDSEFKENGFPINKLYLEWWNYLEKSYSQKWN